MTRMDLLSYTDKKKRHDWIPGDPMVFCTSGKAPGLPQSQLNRTLHDGRRHCIRAGLRGLVAVLLSVDSAVLVDIHVTKCHGHEAVEVTLGTEKVMSIAIG